MQYSNTFLYSLGYTEKDLGNQDRMSGDAIGLHVGIRCLCVCDICGGQSGTGTSFSLSTSLFFLSVLH